MGLDNDLTRLRLAMGWPCLSLHYSVGYWSSCWNSPSPGTCWLSDPSWDPTGRDCYFHLAFSLRWDLFPEVHCPWLAKMRAQLSSTWTRRICCWEPQYFHWSTVGQNLQNFHSAFEVGCWDTRGPFDVGPFEHHLGPGADWVHVQKADCSDSCWSTDSFHSAGQSALKVFHSLPTSFGNHSWASSSAFRCCFEWSWPISSGTEEIVRRCLQSRSRHQRYIPPFVFLHNKRYSIQALQLR